MVENKMNLGTLTKDEDAALYRLRMDGYQRFEVLGGKTFDVEHAASFQDAVKIIKDDFERALKDNYSSVSNTEANKEYSIYDALSHETIEFSHGEINKLYIMLCALGVL